MLSLSSPFSQRKAFKINDVEARGIEPLSSSLSTQTSTCLAGAYSEEPTLHRRTAVSRASTKFLHPPARSLRRKISLLSTFGAVAGVQLQTSRSIKPRERDPGDLRLFFFGSVFYEANEPSSTCRLRFKLQVEASTPPKIPGKNNIGNRGNCATVVAIRIQAIYLFRKPDFFRVTNIKYWVYKVVRVTS